MRRHLPRPAAWLLKMAVPREWRDSIAGDLEEECGRRRGRGQRAGALWATIAAAGVSLRLSAEQLRRPRPGTVTVPRRTGVDMALADLRHAARGLARHRGFTTAAVLTLALGIGANAAVFTAAWHLLLKPLPWPEADRLVQIWNTTRAGGGINVLAPANYLDIEREATLSRQPRPTRSSTTRSISPAPASRSRHVSGPSPATTSRCSA
jgi:hypothetical protein